MENCVCIHGPSNPQWTLERWAPPREKINVLAIEPHVMPDCASMPDEQLLAAYHSLRTPDGDRQIIAYWLKKRGIHHRT